MKKVITLCLFALVMILGTESVMAQSTAIHTEINTEATNKTQELRKQLKLDKSQLEPIYKAFQNHGKRAAELEESNPSKEAILKLNAELDNKIQTILTEEQFEKYKIFSANN